LTDEYAPWREAVANDAPSLLDVPPGVAAPGFYRHRTTHNPVAVWRDPVRGLLGQNGSGREMVIDEGWCERVFAYCQPVPEDWYRAAERSGIWPDHVATAKHNKPPEGLSDAMLQLDDLRMEAQQVLNKGEAKTQAEADLAANLVKRLQDLVDQVNESMKIATEPYHAQLREIEAQRRPVMQQMAAAEVPFLAAATAASTSIDKLKRGYIAPFLIRVREAAKAALAATGVAPGAVSMRDGTMRLTTNAGSKGARVSLTTRWFAEVEDYPKALEALKDHVEVRTAVQKIADSAARSKAKIPIAGVKFHSKEEAR
jgi:hypothetical protein